MTVAKKRGFTIVELLVVITIIGFLMALLFPAINGVRVVARRGQCLNRQRQIGQAIINYTTEHGDQFPARLKARPENSDEAWCWVPFILPYTESASIYDYMSRNTESGNYAVRINAFICPADPPPLVTAAALSYVVNGGKVDATQLAPQNPEKFFDEEYNGIFFRHFPKDPQCVKQSLTYISDHDGTSQTIMLSENVNANLWGPSYANSLESEFCILWERTDDGDHPIKGTCKIQGTTEPVWDVILNGPIESFNPLTEFTPVESMARPSSRHPNGFVVTWCSGSTRFVHQDIGDYIYAQIMTPNGLEIGQPPLSEASIEN